MCSLLEDNDLPVVAAWLTGVGVSLLLFLVSPPWGIGHFLVGCVWELFAWVMCRDTRSDPPPLRTTPSGVLLLGIAQLMLRLSERRVVSSALYSEWREFADSNRRRLGALERISRVQEVISEWDGPPELLLQLNEASRRLGILSDKAAVFMGGYSTESTWSEVFRKGRDRRLKEADLYRWAFQVERLVSPVESFMAKKVGTAPPVEPAGIAFGSTGADLVQFWENTERWNRAVRCLRRELPKPRRIRGRFNWRHPHHV